MPKLDVYHETVKIALIKDGWTITHDPYTLRISGRKRLFADLGASQLISAEKGERRIVVEIKSFLGPSDMADLEQTLGQFILYNKLLAQQEPDRILYVAITETTYDNVFVVELSELLLTDETLRLFLFDEDREVITRWIPHWTTVS